MNRAMKAIILSAGRGQRLKPITDSIPKPLVEIAGKSLLVYHLEQLARAKITEVVINLAWLGKQIEKTIGNGNKFGLNITYSAEPAGGLETAGAIINALPLLTDGNIPFIVINGDIYTEYNFNNLKLTLAKENLAHLVLVNNPSFKTQGDFGLVDGIVNNNQQLTFAGISVLHPKLFDGIELARLKLAPILRQAITKQQIQGELYQGYWSDIGTKTRLEETQKYVNGNFTS